MVDILQAGTYGAPFASANWMLTAGTLVSSHLIFYDPKSGKETATFDFDRPIIGVIVESDLKSGKLQDDRFLATDYLGHPDAIYPGKHFNDRGVEFGPETLSLAQLLQPDGQSGGIASRRQIRVLTAGEAGGGAVPEPATFALIGAALVGFAIVARRWRA